MAIVTLRDLYAAELHDLMNAENQILAELPMMASRATSAPLKRVFEDHEAQTKVHVDRLRLLIEQLNDPAHPGSAGTIAALIQDGHRRFQEAERGDILDAALIAAAQRIEHYEMASYGTARSYASSLGDFDAVRILQQTLDEEGRTDHVLTQVAERGINQKAGDDLVASPTTYRSRLRYMATSDRPDDPEHGVHVHSTTAEHLGVVDGFIIDGSSGQPLYYVIDSRGWFAGGRYVVPVGQIEAADEGATLRTSLTRAELGRYPEFNPRAFTTMDDADAERYERRLRHAFAPDAGSGSHIPPPEPRIERYHER